MLIDWFTVGAQVVNFLVLLWLMKHFLYAPVLAAIGAREKRIAEELAGAAQQRAGAETLRRDLALKTEAFDAERAKLLAQAVANAGVERDRLLAESRNTAEATRIAWQEQWQEARTAQSDRLSKMVTDEVFAISRQVLRDLSGVELEERWVATLLGRLRAMSTDARGSWNAALKIAARETTSSNGPPGVRVRSRYALAASSRALLQTAVNSDGGCVVPLRFEVAADDVDGIEIIAAGQRIAWTITDYLRSLQTTVEALGREALTLSPTSTAHAPATITSAVKESTFALAAAS